MRTLSQNNDGSLKNTLLTVPLLLLLAVAVVGPLSYFALSVLGFIFGQTSSVPLTAGLSQTYMLGAGIFGPLLSVVYLCARKNAALCAALSAAAYGAAILLFMGLHGGLGLPLIFPALLSALVGYGSGAGLALASRRISESLPG